MDFCKTSILYKIRLQDGKKSDHKGNKLLWIYFGGKIPFEIHL